MSEAGIISLISGTTTTIGIIVVAWLNTRQNKLISEVKKNTDGLVTTLLAEKEETSQAKQDLSEAKGHAAGLAEKAAESPTPEKPIEVKIVDQTKPVEVTNKPKK